MKPNPEHIEQFLADLRARMEQAEEVEVAAERRLEGVLNYVTGQYDRPATPDRVTYTIRINGGA